MSFLSFHLKYYRRELDLLESREPSERTVYHAKQLLKILDDLLDEGYTGLNDALEQDCGGVSRLRKYLRNNGARPFPVIPGLPKGENLPYEPEKTELTHAVEEAVTKARTDARPTGDCPTEFLEKIAQFTHWIGRDADTGYIFLLRDTLLPCIRFRETYGGSVYPWLLGRKTLAQLTGQTNADDAIRASVFRVLEEGDCRDFSGFCAAVLPEIRKTMEQYPHARDCLRKMLDEIPENRILIAESGCTGTFPLLLMSLDERADMRMYTAYPYLRDLYGDRIFTPAYEEIRLFETMYSQDLYFRYAGMENGRFYVSRCTDPGVEQCALAEIRGILNLQRKNK